MDAGSLRESLAPLTRHERVLAWTLAIVVAMTRWPALSQTLWDWDEALFALALSDFDVTLHQPHPPGFPLFIAAAKLMPFDAFHALQAVTFLASLVVFPAMFFLARELRASAGSAMSAGLLLAFFPNVWFYGGTAFSDVPSMVLVVTASALLLRGCRHTPSLLAGSLLLGVAAGLRPQNLMIGGLALLIAFFYRRRTALTGALIVAAIVAGTYGSAAALSGGWSVYRDTVSQHGDYIRNTDSFLAPIRPSLIEVADDFFFWPWRAPLLNIALVVLAAVGLVRRRRWMAVAIFGPFCIFAWLLLDFHSASRFSIAYMPLFAFLAAEGVPRQYRYSVVSALAAALAIWTWPALRVVHETPSPPVAAIEAIRNMNPAPTKVYVDDRLRAHAELLLSGFLRQTVTIDGRFQPEEGTVLLHEGESELEEAQVFRRGRQRLADIARPRYFEVSVVSGGQGEE